MTRVPFCMHLITFSDARYQVMNFQKFPNGSYGYVQIASWEQGRLDFSNSRQWKDYSEPPYSVCSEECTKGHAKVRTRYN